MNIIKSCIYCSQEEVEPIYLDKEIKYLHCYCCKKSYTLMEALDYLRLSPAEKVYFRYAEIAKENK